MQKINTLIFDGSGVLINDLPAVFRANKEAYLMHGYEPPQTLEEFREKFTFPVREFHRSNGIPEEEIDSVERTYFERFSIYRDLIEPFPETADVLCELKQRGIQLGIYSNVPKKDLRELLEKFGILMYFDAIIGQGDGEEKKPSPKPILNVLSRLNTTPESAAYVGDMEEDMTIGRRAGVRVIAMDREEAYQPIERLKLHNPDYVITSLYDLLQIV